MESDRAKGSLRLVSIEFQIAAVLAASLTASICSAEPGDARPGPRAVSLNGEWDFTYCVASAADTPELPAAFDAKIKVPGRWDEQLDRVKSTKWWPEARFWNTLGPVKFLAGIGWHRTWIEAPAEWKDRRVTLEIGWAVGVTSVWLNRQLVGKYEYGVYTPFEFDLTERLRSGERNELIVAVDNTKGFAGGWAYLGLAGRASGLWRPVTLHIAGGRGRISDLYLRPGADLKEVVQQVELEAGDQPAPDSTIEWQVRGPNNREVLVRGQVAVGAFSGGRKKITWKHSAARIKPWSDRQPNLYWASVKWVAAGQVWDYREQRFGLRRWSYKGRQLFLNDVPIYLRGDMGPYYFPVDCAMPTRRDYYEERFKAAKSIGLNFVNFAAKVAPPEMLEVADELGIIVQCGDEETAMEPHRDAYKDVWGPILRATRKHPSLCIYGFGGEHDYYEGIIEQFQKQHDLIHELNPECLVMPQQAFRGIDYAFDDKAAKELAGDTIPLSYHPKRLAAVTGACDIFGHYSCGAFGYNFFDNPWQQMEQRFAVYQRPLVAHELYMRSSYLRPENAAKYTGRCPPFYYTDLEQKLKALGLLDKWGAYHQNSGRTVAITRKYCVEKTRKCDGLAGYEFLGFTDQNFMDKPPLYLCGILDEFLQPKPGDTLEGLKRYMGESVLLIDYPGDSINRSFREGEWFSADLMASLFGQQPLSKGTLEWTLKRGSERVLGRKLALAKLPNGHVSKLTTIKLQWPAVRETTKLGLAVTLQGSGYALANDWDFWVFPRAEAPQVAAAADEKAYGLLSSRYMALSPLVSETAHKLRITSQITPADLEHLASGGDLLLLGSKPFPTVDLARYPGHASLAENAGVIISGHPIFAGLPDEGWGDWHFMPLLQNAVCVRFDELATGFDPVLEVISSPNEPRKQAAIFEKRVGKGRLLVCGCAINLRNPSGVALIDGILRYMSGENFHPRGELNLAVLRDLVIPSPAKAVAPPQAVAAAAPRQAPPERTWHNQSVKVNLEGNLQYRIEGGEWTSGSELTVTKEGINKVFVRKNRDSPPEMREVCIDLTPPVIRASSNPLTTQLGGVLQATPATLFSFAASNELSGIRALEISIDDGDFSAYSKAFLLPVGRHKLRCRATDFAGNRCELMEGGPMTGGGRTDSIMVEVKDQ